MTFLLTIYALLKAIKPRTWEFLLIAVTAFLLLSVLYAKCTYEGGGLNKNAEQTGANANNAQRNADVINGQIIEQNKILENANLDRQNANTKVLDSLNNLNRARNANGKHASAGDLENAARNY